MYLIPVFCEGLFMFNFHDGSVSESSAAVESELESLRMLDLFLYFFADSISSKIKNTIMLYNYNICGLWI